MILPRLKTKIKKIFLDLSSISNSYLSIQKETDYLNKKPSYKIRRLFIAVGEGLEPPRGS